MHPRVTLHAPLSFPLSRAVLVFIQKIKTRVGLSSHGRVDVHAAFRSLKDPVYGYEGYWSASTAGGSP